LAEAVHAAVEADEAAAAMIIRAMRASHASLAGNKRTARNKTLHGLVTANYIEYSA
jgi:prophage maintenance system killer protein